MSNKNIFLNYVQAGYPLLWVSTSEESRALTVFAKELKQVDYRIFSWDACDSVTERVLLDNELAFQPLPLEMLTLKPTSKKAVNEYVDDKIKEESAAQTLKMFADPLVILDWADKTMPNDSILFLKDYHNFIKKGNNSRKIKNLIPKFKASGKVLVILSHAVDIPPEIEKETTVVNFGLPLIDDLRVVLKGLVESINSTSTKTVDYPKEDVPVLEAALGMTAFEAENAFSVSLVEKKCFDVKTIQREKAAIVKKTGLLEVIETSNKMSDVGGANNIKEWLSTRKGCFSQKARDFGLRPPKGILFIGIPGTGKSLLSKCIAAGWNRPLLRLDVGKVYQSLLGESENNLRKCLHMAEAISPCLLWIDELEKAFSGTKGEVDGGTSKRIFGSFLTWLSEKTADVFIVATANNVSALPPEFLRSGRFDVIFFVDLPDEIQREEIIKIHLEKVSRKIKDFDMPELVKASDTFTGAEIEVWVQEALALAFSKESELKTEHMISKAQEITPIARLMEEDIKKSREWAKSHGVKPAYIPAPKLAVKVKVNGDGPRKVNLN